MRTRGMYVATPIALLLSLFAILGCEEDDTTSGGNGPTVNAPVDGGDAGGGDGGGRDGGAGGDGDGGGEGDIGNAGDGDGGGGDGNGCDLSYPDVCIPPPPPDLDCGDISERRFTVSGSDPHGFDGDFDGIGCESA